jgi:type III restriction enzyme
VSGLEKIDKIIINGPYDEPKCHWKYDQSTKTFSIEKGRREAGYIIASDRSRSYDDPGTFVPLPLVNKLRLRVNKWRESEYPGASSISKRLLEYWRDREDGALQPFFFCQIEAIETLMWIVEAPPSEKVGIDIKSDGGEFIRYCSKMATGTGKTLVMSMVIAWQTLNKASHPKDTRFSSNFFIVAPGLTVKSRLQVLDPTNKDNYYVKFNIVPPGLFNLLRSAKVIIANWHGLQWDSDEQIAKRKSVDKRGAISDDVYVKQVLGDMAASKNIIVINDEAHHAWRVPAEMKTKKPTEISKDEIDEATKWVDGLDRIHKARGILACFDFSATPFSPTGKSTKEEALFQWIVSDFGLNDAIESGLVKTPRVVVRDDGVHDVKTYKSKFYQIYDQISEDITRKAQAHEGLPDLLTAAYSILGYDWREQFVDWKKGGSPVPPVMISVVNTIETAARIKYAFDHNNIMIEELCDPKLTIQIDSKKIKQSDEELRGLVDTVGQVGEPGEQIRNVISVGMLSEGWDAKTVTHIMGLRAFTSQLLCEQVVGRGLRRMSYEVNKEGIDKGFLNPEYVNVFGVPFSFLPHEGGDGGPSFRPNPPKIKIEPLRERAQFEINWPNVLRIDHRLDYNLKLDHEKLEDLEIKVSDMPTMAELAPILEGRPDYSKLSEIDLKEIAGSLRLQTIIFKFATHLLPSIENEQKWKGGKHQLFADLVSIIERYVSSSKIRINPKYVDDDSGQRNLFIRLNMEKIIRHVSRAIISQNATAYDILYDTSEPVRYTRDAGIWYTTKRCLPYKKTHMNLCVFDNSTWEEHAAKTLDADKNVAAWVKNDHIGFEISYLFNGVVRKYLPDFLVRFTNGDHLILEIKGLERDKDKEKWAYLDEWCKAVTSTQRYGKWTWGVSKDPNELKGLLLKRYEG